MPLPMIFLLILVVDGIVIGMGILAGLTPVVAVWAAAALNFLAAGVFCVLAWHNMRNWSKHDRHL